MSFRSCLSSRCQYRLIRDTVVSRTCRSDQLPSDHMKYLKHVWLLSLLCTLYSDLSQRAITRAGFGIITVPNTLLEPSTELLMASQWIHGRHTPTRSTAYHNHDHKEWSIIIGYWQQQIKECANGQHSQLIKNNLYNVHALYKVICIH